MLNTIADLASFSKILVTGPQRSGTRFGARVIAHDLGHEYVDEVKIHTDGLYALYVVVTQWTDRNLVIQCPALCRYVHLFGGNPDVVVVLMRREVQHIIDSMEHIAWREAFEHLEMFRYPPEYHTDNIALTKYHYWSEHQRALIDNYLELSYEGLSDHPLWVPPQLRGLDWGFTQTSLDEKGR